MQTIGKLASLHKKLSLAEWLEYVATYNFGPTAPTRVVLHHTFVPNESQWNGFASMTSMQRYYANKGWTAAPHVFAAPDGIYLMTPMKDVGIHAGTGNSGWSNGIWWYSIGLEMVGDFDKERPKGAVWDHSKAVLGSLSKRLGIPPRNLISFHRDYTTEKSCPGKAVTKEWVWSEVEAWIKQTAQTTYYVIAPSAPIYEAPSTSSPIAWAGQAIMGHGNSFSGIDQNNGFIWHTGGIGFVEASLLSTKLDQQYKSDADRAGFTEYDTVTADGFDITPEQAIAYMYKRKHAAEYSKADITLIVNTIYKLCKIANIRFAVAIAMLIKETDNLCAYLAGRKDKDGRPLRNPAGIGVYEEKVKATKHYRDGCVWDGDVQGYRPSCQFKSWELESCPALVGRLLAWCKKDSELNEEQKALVSKALSFRNLPNELRGSVTTMRELGAAHNPTGQGWAYRGVDYGAGLASIANTILQY